MKILNAQQLSEIDQKAIEAEKITSWDLMERAAKHAVDAILPLLKPKSKIHLFCGVGNNGGDGLAMAYFLKQFEFSVQVYKIAFSDQPSPDFLKNEKRLLKNEFKITSVDASTEIDFAIEDDDVLIDAIFGVGLNRKLPEFVEKCIELINQSKAKCFSIDLPSGMFLNSLSSKTSAFVHPDVCLTFQLPKLPLLLPDYAQFVGQFQLVYIGLSAKAIQQSSTLYNYVDLAFAQTLYKHRKRFSHKGSYGHALLVGGQKGMLGSVLLASRAAMKSGVGKLSVMLPNCGHTSLHTYLPEAMAVHHDAKKYISFTNSSGYNAIGIGVGIGTKPNVVKAFTSYLSHVNQPILLDADALNILAEHSFLLELLPKNSILTPHPGELKRLIGHWKDDFDKLTKIKAFAQKYEIIVVAKDAITCVCDGTHFYFNASGNSGMATAGSGDVLSGIITSLLAQSYEALAAAQLGVFVHGSAGNLALKCESEESLIASNLTENLGKAFQLIQS
jgi:hydroxyethylthiazole kinase-like uncharacterized protein yjeF